MTEPDVKARIFISYARSDGEDFARKLRQRLLKEKLTIWRDRDEMEGGVGWWKQITEALDSVEFMVLVASPAAMASPVVAKEWRYARQQGVCVYPVQVPGLPVDFKKLPRWMSDTHFYDLDKEWETFVNYLKNPCQADRVPYFGVPDLPEHFVQRPSEFEQLKSHLLDKDRQNPVAITTALKGAGGFGKTTLAVALCHDDEVQTAYDDGILWVTLGEKPDVAGGLLKLYAALTGERPAFVDAEDAAANLAEKLADKDCLIVIDDVWNMAHLRPFLRGGERCARLFTTRDSGIAAQAASQPTLVDEMSSAESVDLLRGGDTGWEETALKALAARLGEWALLLEIGRGMLRERMTTLGETPEHALNWLNKVLDKRGIGGLQHDDEDRRKQSAAGVLAGSLELLTDAQWTRLTDLAIFKDDIDIPLSAIGTLWDSDEIDTDELIARFAKLSLLKYDAERGTIRLHDVVREHLLGQITNPAAVHGRLLDGWGEPPVTPSRPPPYTGEESGAAGATPSPFTGRVGEGSFTGRAGEGSLAGRVGEGLLDPFAWRWTIYHMLAAGRDATPLLLNFGWLQGELEATDVNWVLGDIELALTPNPSPTLRGSSTAGRGESVGAQHATVSSQAASDSELGTRYSALRLLQSALRMSAHVLGQPTQLAAQLTGRLLPHRDNPLIATLLDSVQPDYGWLRPLTPTHDPAGGALQRTFSGHSAYVWSVAFSPDGRWLASASSDQTVKLWEVSSGQELRSFSGHSDWVRSVAFSPDGRWLASASSDRTLKLWEAATGDCIYTFYADMSLWCCAWSLDGRRIAAGDSGGRVMLLGVEGF